MRRTAYDRYDRKLLLCLPVPNGAGHPNHHPSALLAVLPMVLEQELSPRQRTCLRAFYVDGKSQTEIARRLGLSQATVSYHIHAAKAAANRLLHYCQIAVAKANDCWLEAENNGL